ncbi:YkvI family membrane protein [Saliterribacillus persicus]|nr:hypothetical protein [Saliterribacillus persicus]
MWRNGLKWIFLIVGTMIGAGYASGRELWQFFGPESGLAIFIFTLLLMIAIYVAMSISRNLHTEHYFPLLETLVGRKIAKIYDAMIIFYLFSTTSIMFAGSGATFEAFYLPYWLGIMIIITALILVFTYDIEGVLVINSFILPLLLTGLLIVLIDFTLRNDLSFVTDLAYQSNWKAAFTFTALNMLSIIAVIGAVGNNIKTKQEIWIAAVGSSVILGAISFIYNNSLIQIKEEILVYEIPLFAILKDYPFSLYIVISILLWCAIFTTAIASTLGLVSRLKQFIHLPLWKITIILSCLMLPLVSIGFSTLIKYIYPLYGMLNLYLLSALILNPFITKIEKKV